jgi:hypothetical protein
LGLKMFTTPLLITIEKSQASTFYGSG